MNTDDQKAAALKNYQRKYQKENREKLVEKSKKYYEENKTELLAKQKEYYQKTKEEHSARARLYYEAHREELYERKQKRIKENPEAFKVALKYTWQKQKARRNLPHIKIARYKNSAKRRNIEWLLTDDEATVVLERECFYCGKEPELSNGIDRKDNDGPYIMTNIVTACKECNWMKGTVHIDDFLEQCRKVAQKNPKQQESKL